jgi:hypothetical protein
MPGQADVAPASVERAKVVVRHADGRILKGHTFDFYPNKARFHLFTSEDATGDPIEVSVADLKAVFFVRNFAGDPGYNERKQFPEGFQLAGRRVEVTFVDGEVLVGSTTGDDPRRPGFFVVPADPRSNNLRVFAVTSAVSKVRYL